MLRLFIQFLILIALVALPRSASAFFEFAYLPGTGLDFSTLTKYHYQVKNYTQYSLTVSINGGEPFELHNGESVQLPTRGIGADLYYTIDYSLEHYGQQKIRYEQFLSEKLEPAQVQRILSDPIWESERLGRTTPPDTAEASAQLESDSKWLTAEIERIMDGLSFDDVQFLKSTGVKLTLMAMVEHEMLYRAFEGQWNLVWYYIDSRRSPQLGLSEDWLYNRVDKGPAVLGALILDVGVGVSSALLGEPLAAETGVAIDLAFPITPELRIKDAAYLRGYISGGAYIFRAGLNEGSYTLSPESDFLLTTEGISYEYRYGAFDIGVRVAARPRFFIEPAIGLRVPVGLALSFSEEETYINGAEVSDQKLLTIDSIRDNAYLSMAVGGMFRGRPDMEGFHGGHLSIVTRAYRWSGTTSPGLYSGGSQPVPLPEAGDITVDVFVMLGISLPSGSD